MPRRAVLRFSIVFRFTALLLIGLVANALVAAATPCCCLRASAPSRSATGKTRPVRRCCGSSAPARKGECPPAHGDCACKAGTVAPEDRPATIAIAPSDLATPAFVLVLDVREPASLAPVACLPRDVGPPRAPSSASPALLPVLRV